MGKLTAFIQVMALLLSLVFGITNAVHYAYLINIEQKLAVLNAQQVELAGAIEKLDASVIDLQAEEYFMNRRYHNDGSK